MKHSQFKGVINNHDDTQFLQKLTKNIVDPVDLEQLKQAASYVFKAINPDDLRPSALDIALTLKHLGVDAETLVAALLSDLRLRTVLDNYTIDQQFNSTIANLVKHVNWLNTFKECSEELAYKPAEAESLHQMLLATVDDVRAVLIKLAFRLQRLRMLENESKKMQYCIAQETMDIYAPLANRLGLSNLKWELEDLAFRYIDFKSYKSLAKSMADTRTARETYIEHFVEHLHTLLSQSKLEAKIYGRPKHLFSIWKKMQKKQVQWHELADLLAVRIIAPTLSQCYMILGIVHNQWQHLPHEFDDYIANTKDNGYQSIHTAIIGSDNQVIEIQIRTQEMHDFAEHGVAAHWRYKEGSNQDVALVNTIATLRRLLDNSIDNDTLLEEFKTEFFNDRVLVLTPQKDVVNLPAGATALDFAYAIHTEVGHQCMGALVNGHRVPLSYPIKSGECIEILTDKDSNPHLYWLDHHRHYVNTIRAKSRIRLWFKALFKEDDNKQLVTSKLLKGIGDHKISLALCCEPQVGDRITGELLKDRTIRIHDSACQKIRYKQLTHNKKTKIIELTWGEQAVKSVITKLKIHIIAFDRQGLLHDVTTLLNKAQVNVLKANTKTDMIDQSVSMKFRIELNSMDQSETLLKKILQVPNVFHCVLSKDKKNSKSKKPKETEI